MAMTVTEANALNELLNWLFNNQPLDRDSVSDDQARDAAAVLAQSSYKRLYAGYNEREVLRLWRERVETR